MGSEQNDSTSVPQSQPKLCANNCGFFGTEQSMNLCSKCYRDIRMNEEQAASAKAAMEKSFNPKQPKQEDNIPNKNNNNDQNVSADDFSAELVVGPSTTTLSAGSSSSSAGLTAGGDQIEPKVSNRCGSCNKKVGLTGFKCKCGSTFCGTHRYPEKHECTFDFKEAGRDAIAKANPVVKADKVERF